MAALSRVDPRGAGEIGKEHWTRISQFPLINAVARGVQAGLVYADPSQTVVVVATKSGFSLVNTLDPEPAASFGAELLAFLRDTPEIPRYVHLYGPPRAVVEYVGAHAPRHRRRRRAQFRLHATGMTFAYEDLLPPGHRIATVQEVGVDRLEEVFRLDFGHRYWDSREEFLAGAIGTCLVSDHGGLLAVCYSACIVDGVAEVDTVVVPEHRGKGLLKVVSEPYFNLAVARRLTPHWDTFVENRPSYAMVRNFGLTEVQEYELVSILLS
jgi:hypothetical protein